MADCKSCETCAYIGKSENDYPCNKCTNNASDKWQPMTNADRIRSMSDSELAEWLAGIDHYWDDGECIVNFGVVRIQDSKEDILDWLQSEIE